MTPDANTDLSGAARFGHVLGRGLRRILNVERAFWSLFDRAGVPRVIITPVKWGARAAVIGIGAFFAAWGLLYVLSFTVLLAIGLGIVNSSSVENGLYTPQLDIFNDALEDEQISGDSGWMVGNQGYGYYQNGLKQS
ncbi:hypothetical protein PSYAE_21650 [Pseudomonas amygdali pv. aesculi str. 0893_23]|uniref:DUF3742 family protein n=1 Tax=Pseudomonas syringae group genomosp. 2 TaxID=251698 RepID=UPI0001CC405C|nr:MULTISPECIES: DUF3742 family protein [Pseudomonas syringae group genomosp. 2]EGH04510.1 hypothetical protein PSYAE_21650 [Pseudomonas amygdali pv. aesculi str. 0893_23]KPW22326.1 Uncharacterized protein ALO90_01188 [Pseudomonas amygdali pv. aesculi]MCQ3010635.1 DUF3742 family protein [Pseudomonas savastanoi]